MPSPKHTATRIPHTKRNAIVVALGNGESKVSISRRLHTSEHIVDIIAQEDWQQVAARKLRLAAQYERIADQANNRILEQLDSSKEITLPVLVPVSGMATDKAIALRSDPTIHIEHSHQHIHAHISNASYQELLAKLPRRNPTAVTDIEAHKTQAEDTPA